MATENDQVVTASPSIYPLGLSESHKPLSERPGPLLRHNPVTAQLVIVGKRRERAEAQLEGRLRAAKEAHS